MRERKKRQEGKGEIEDRNERRRTRAGSSILPLADIYSVNRQTDGQTMMLIARWTKASIA